jgi:hemolysin activation/secretion protein
MPKHLPAVPAFLLIANLACAASEAGDGPDRWGFGIQPIIGYDDDAGWTLGANSAFYHNPDPSNQAQELDELDLTTTGTAKGAYNVNADVTKNFGGDGRALETVVGYEKAFHEDFGLGDQSQGIGNPIYTTIDIPFNVSYSLELFDHLYASPIYDFHYQEIARAESEGATAQAGSIRDGSTRSSGIGIGLTYKTTNAGIYKRRGFSLSLASTRYSSALGSSSEFELSSLTYKHYVPVFDESVLGFHFRFETSSGDVPLFYLPALGGNKLVRGFKDTRYMGKHCVAGQTEFRFPIWWRLGGTVFVGAGEAADRLDGFGRHLEVAGGVGLRLTVQTKQKINVRFDFAYNSDGGIGKYIKLKEAF